MDKKCAEYLDKLDGKLILLLKDLKNYREEKLNERPDENSWSVLQIMRHLIKAESESLKYVRKKLSFNPELKNAGIMSGIRSAMLRIALSSPIKIKAPEGVSGEALSENYTFWEVAKEWKSQRTELREYLGSLPSYYFKKDMYKHPLTGKMTLASMLSFFDIHVDRHTRQIKRTLRKVDAVKQV